RSPPTPSARAPASATPPPTASPAAAGSSPACTPRPWTRSAPFSACSPVRCSSGCPRHASRSGRDEGPAPPGTGPSSLRPSTFDLSPDRGPNLLRQPADHRRHLGAVARAGGDGLHRAGGPDVDQPRIQPDLAEVV